MHNISPIDIRELSTKQQIIDLALTDVEDFRAQGYLACRNFTKKEREDLKSIASQHVNSYELLSLWQDNLKPRIKKLSKERTNSEFINSLTKHLSVDESEAQSVANELVSKRQQKNLINFANSVYTKPEKGRDRLAKKRNTLIDFLSKSEKEIDKIRKNLVEYMMFDSISRAQKITILDPTKNIFTKSKLKRRIERERKLIFKNNRKRLNDIYSRLEELSKNNDGLIVKINDRKWDLMTILALKNNYEKKISKLSDDKPDSVNKRLSIFESEIKEFKERELDKMETLPNQTSIDLARVASEDIDKLLLQIFNLTNIQKNQLVLQMKEFRELNVERKDIISELGKLSI